MSEAESRRQNRGIGGGSFAAQAASGICRGKALRAAEIALVDVRSIDVCPSGSEVRDSSPSRGRESKRQRFFLEAPRAADNAARERRRFGVARRPQAQATRVKEPKLKRRRQNALSIGAVSLQCDPALRANGLRTRAPQFVAAKAVRPSVER